jgi:hypothetical protein
MQPGTRSPCEAVSWINSIQLSGNPGTPETPIITALQIEFVRRKIGQRTNSMSDGLDFRELAVIDGDELGRCQSLAPS